VRFAPSAAVLVLALSAGAAQASIWPTAIARTERELASPEVELRRQAARRLSRLPPKARSRLLERALGDADVEVRLAAAEVGKGLDDFEIGQRVLTWLSDPEPRLRLAAAEILRVRPSDAALLSLGRALSDADPAVRTAAARALGSSRSADAVVALLGRLDDPVPDVREAVADALGRVGDRRAVVPLIGKIEDTVPSVRRAVARALGELFDPRAVSALVLVLRDADEAVRVAVLDALGRLGDPSAVPSIVAVLNARATGAVRESSLRALGRIGSPEAFAAMVAELAYDEPDRDRATVLQALGRAGSRAADALRACLSARSALFVADGCVLGLGLVGAAPDAALVRSALTRGDVSPFAAFSSLASLGNRDALPVVLERIADDDPTLRRAAREAAASLLSPEEPDGRAVDPLLRALARRIPLDERVELVALLGRTGSKRAAEPLATVAGSATDPGLLSAAFEALGRLGPTVHERVFLTGLDSEYGKVRLAAALSLRRVASGALAGELLRRLAEAPEADREALALALAGAASRTTDRKLVSKVERLLQSSLGADRDALLEVLGQLPNGQGVAALARFATARNGTADRRKVAEVVAGVAQARPLLASLALDADGSVRASAVWSLASLATPAELPLLERALGDRDGTVAANAAVALARAGARLKTDVAAALCKATADPRANVRSNALAGLRLSGRRCDAASMERLLLRDRSDIVREAAARTLSHGSPSEADKKLLARCALDDERENVAAACAEPAFPLPTETDWVLVYVVPAGEIEPLPTAPFAIVFSDGTRRFGRSDRRGAVFERLAPRGEISLGASLPFSD
jgi:HEAT repeat protein